MRTYKIKVAREMVEELNKAEERYEREEDQWSYIAVNLGDGMARIDAYDNDGELVQKGVDL